MPLKVEDNKPRTLERCIADYSMGFTTTIDGDTKKTVVGTECEHCGNHFEDLLEIDDLRVAPFYCIACAAQLEVADTLKHKELYDIHGYMEDMAAETKVLKYLDFEDLSLDECEIEWMNKYVCNLETFLNAYTNLLIDNIEAMIRNYRRKR
jgi:hypothetical protein